MMEGKDEKRKKIIVDEKVKNYIEESGCDFRVRTSCGGPSLCPVKYSPIKKTDIDIITGKQMLYVSNSVYISRYYRDREGFLKIGRELIGSMSCRF